MEGLVDTTAALGRANIKMQEVMARMVDGIEKLLATKHTEQC